VGCRDDQGDDAVLLGLGLRRTGPEAESGSNGVQCSMLNLNALKM
jgi:hypothetical protein